MTARDAATIACRVLAVYIVFETINANTRVYFQYATMKQTQISYSQLLLIPLFILIAIFLWREGGKWITRSLKNPDGEIDSALSMQQWVSLAVSCIGIFLLIGSLQYIAHFLNSLSVQIGFASGFKVWAFLSLASGIFMPIYGLIIISFTAHIAKGLIYLQTFKLENQSNSKILTIQSLALSILGIWLFGRLAPQILQYLPMFMRSPSFSVNQPPIL
ncbi:hypothetical protein K8I31_14580, partial [bacterium]|nr:hypothetical protein [bacterium]